MIGRGLPGVGDLAGGLIGHGVDARVANRVEVEDLGVDPGHRGLVQLGVVLVVNAEPALEQQPVRVRPRPFGHADEARRRHLHTGGLGRHVGRDAPVVAVLQLVVVVVGDLVPAANLPRDARRVAHDMAVVDARVVVIRRVAER
jgi:hypothetical protein